MGSTFVRFGERGFEADDSIIEIWLGLLLAEIDKLGNRPEWLQEVEDEWRLQATAGFGFGVMPGLDRFVTDEARREVILQLADRAAANLRARGSELPADELNQLGLGGDGATFTRAVPVSTIQRTADYFTRLLRGTLGADEVDARFG